MLRAIVSANRIFGRFGRAREGAAAVEFAMLALPFFLLMFGLAEITIIGFAQTSLDYSVSEAARLIRTGQNQAGGATYAQVKDQVCTELTKLMPMDCANNLFLDVDNYTSFVSVQNPSPISGGAFSSTGFGYNPGAPSDVVIVRVFYRWKVITPFFQGVFQNISGGERVLTSTMMFRNEPYSP